MNRRTFIQRTSFGTAAMIGSARIPSFSLSANQKQALRIGIIGCGWYGMVITKAALKEGDVEIAAICDVDSAHLQKCAAEIQVLQGKTPNVYKDYQELLDLEPLDAVVIATPPHWHALQFCAACEKGLPIYCEKPLSYDVEEGKAMVRAAQKAGNIVQIGFQRRQSAAFQKAKEMIGEGVLGEIRQVGAQIHYNPAIADTTVQNPPASLDWDAWCGPAPKLPYKPSIGHMAWRLEREYGNGHLADWGIHHIDIIRSILDIGVPESIHTNGSLNVLKGKITTPDTLLAAMNFKEFPVIWQHRLWGTGGLNPALNNGIFFYGEQATLFASDNKLILTTSGKEQQQINLSTPDMQEKHVSEFLYAVRTNNPHLLRSTVVDAFQSTTAVQLAMISYYTDSEVKWDAAKQTIIQNPKASSLLSRVYRKGYKKPV